MLKLILFFVILGLKVPKSMQHFKKDRNAKRKKKIFIKWQWVFKSHTKGKRCHAICKTHKTKDKSGAEQRSKFSEFISNQDISTAKKKKVNKKIHMYFEWHWPSQDSILQTICCLKAQGLTSRTLLTIWYLCNKLPVFSTNRLEAFIESLTCWMHRS